MFFMRTHISSLGIETVHWVARKNKVIDMRFGSGGVGAIIRSCSLTKPVIWKFRSTRQLIFGSFRCRDLCRGIFFSEWLIGFISFVFCLSAYKQVWVSNYA